MTQLTYNHQGRCVEGVELARTTHHRDCRVARDRGLDLLLESRHSLRDDGPYYVGIHVEVPMYEVVSHPDNCAPLYLGIPGPELV